MVIIELHKFIENEQDFKLIACMETNDYTEELISDLRILSKKYKFKYILNFKEYNIKNKTGVLIKIITIEEV